MSKQPEKFYVFRRIMKSAVNTIITSPNFYSMPETIKNLQYCEIRLRGELEKPIFFHGIAQAAKLLAPLIHRWCSTQTASIYGGLLRRKNKFT
jgi:hypothetical protein